MYKQIDERIARLLEKFSEEPKENSVWDEEVAWGSPMSEEDVAAYEKEKGIHLPKEYRRFITTVGGSGNQPFYGLTHLDKQDEEQCIPEQPFPIYPGPFSFFPLYDGGGNG